MDDLDHLETVSCNLCGTNNLQFSYQMPDTWYFQTEIFKVVECQACHLGFVNPRPKPQSIDRYYPKDFFDGFNKDPEFHSERYRREGEFLKYARKTTDGRPCLLDVGCANGGFARHVQTLGWDVEGVEVASNVEKHSDFQVYRCPLPEIPVFIEKYDAVTAWAVIEHVHDPKSYFKKVAQVLKKEGIFIFLVTNFESTTSRYLYREDVPRHLYFFSHDSVKKYLDTCGLSLEYAKSDNRIYSLRPLHWLRFFSRRLFGLRPLAFDEQPETRQDYYNRLKCKPTILLDLKFALTHPITLIDRLLMPLYEKVQMARNTYGITTYVARKK